MSDHYNYLFEEMTRGFYGDDPAPCRDCGEVTSNKSGVCWECVRYDAATTCEGCCDPIPDGLRYCVRCFEDPGVWKGNDLADWKRHDDNNCVLAAVDVIHQLNAGWVTPRWQSWPMDTYPGD